LEKSIRSTWCGRRECFGACAYCLEGCEGEEMSAEDRALRFWKSNLLLLGRIDAMDNRGKHLYYLSTISIERVQVFQGTCRFMKRKMDPKEPMNSKHLFAYPLMATLSPFNSRCCPDDSMGILQLMIAVYIWDPG
jgi:hypothetical protein